MAELTRVSTGFGDARAPIDTEAWAQRWRVDLYGAVAGLDSTPGLVESLVSLGTKHRTWTLLKRADGKPFRTFEEFCSTPWPHGIGADPKKIQQALEFLHGKKGAQLATVSEAAEPKAGPGRGHKSPTAETSEDKTEAHDEPSFSEMPEATAKRLRAINRAPDTVKDAYREGRISQTLAAKLGPKNPTPEVAAKVAEVAGEIRKIKDRKEVDRVVRDRLGQQKPTIVEQAFRLVERMTPAERSDFERQIRPLLGATE